MKRCPKCNRSFPEENQKFCTVDGGLLITEQTFDPNMTIRATSAELLEGAITPDNAATSRKLPDIGAITASGDAQRGSVQRSTSPTGTPTSSPLSPLPAAPIATGATGQLVEPQKKSKLPLVLGILALLLLLGIGGIAGLPPVAITTRRAR